MKQLIRIAVLWFVVSQASGQKITESEVPAVVKASLAKAYPSATQIKWEKEDGQFEASFGHEKEVSVLIDAQGVILEEETEIAKSDLPKAVQASLARDYGKYKLEETARIVAKGVTTFEAEVELGESSYELIFDSNGKLLKKTTIEDRD